MSTGRTFSFDEKSEAEKIILNGFSDAGLDYTKMYLIAKYFRETFNYGEIRLERELIKFCKENDPNFNPVVEADSIRKWVRSAMKYNLRKIDCVYISEKEVEFLSEIENDRDRKLLFITLVLSKALKNNSTRRVKSPSVKKSEKYYIRYSNFMDIIKLSKLKNFTELDLADLFNKYKASFTFYSAEQELVRLDFADPVMEKKIEINNLDKIIDYYSLMFGEKKATCQICGRLFSKRAGNQKYCPSCSGKIKREQGRLRQAKWRESKK